MTEFANVLTDRQKAEVLDRIHATLTKEGGSLGPDYARGSNEFADWVDDQIAKLYYGDDDEID